MGKEELNKRAEIRDSLQYVNSDINKIDDLNSRYCVLFLQEYRIGKEIPGILIPLKLRYGILNLLSAYFKQEKQNLEKQLEEK